MREVFLPAGLEEPVDRWITKTNGVKKCWRAYYKALNKMGFYQKHIEPRLVSLACSSPAIARERRKVVPHAEGVVLEVGFGSGHNLPFYDAGKVTKLFALEPEEKIKKLAAKRVAASPLEIDYLDLPGEQIPLEDRSIDTVLVTFTMCTIPDLPTALEGMARVLKPSGRMLFAEHGLSPDGSVAEWQNRLNGIWGCLGGGCNLNRDIPALVTGNGFQMEQLEAQYAKNTPKFAGYIFSGRAKAI